MKVSKLFSRHLITWPHFFSLLLEEKHENYVKLARSIKIFWELYFLTLYLPVCFKCLTSLHHFYNVKKPTYAKYNNISLLPKLWFVLCVLASTLLKTGFKKTMSSFCKYPYVSIWQYSCWMTNWILRNPGNSVLKPQDYFIPVNIWGLIEGKDHNLKNFMIIVYKPYSHPI